MKIEDRPRFRPRVTMTGTAIGEIKRAVRARIGLGASSPRQGAMSQLGEHGDTMSSSIARDQPQRPSPRARARRDQDARGEIAYLRSTRPRIGRADRDHGEDSRPDGDRVALRVRARPRPLRRELTSTTTSVRPIRVKPRHRRLNRRSARTASSSGTGISYSSRPRPHSHDVPASYTTRSRLAIGSTHGRRLQERHSTVLDGGRGESTSTSRWRPRLSRRSPEAPDARRARRLEAPATDRRR